MAAVVVPLPIERILDLRRVADRRRVHAADLAARVITDWLDTDGADELLAAYEAEIAAVRARADRDTGELRQRGTRQRPAV